MGIRCPESLRPPSRKARTKSSDASLRNMVTETSRRRLPQRINVRLATALVLEVTVSDGRYPARSCSTRTLQEWCSFPCWRRKAQRGDRERTVIERVSPREGLLHKLAFRRCRIRRHRGTCPARTCVGQNQGPTHSQGVAEL